MHILLKINTLTGRYFAVLAILFAVIGLSRPETFLWILPNIALFLGIVMLGMGMAIKTADWKYILSHPWQVLLGVLVQYTVMPFLAFLICFALELPPELAIGVILLGACPGGTASNVITYLAKGDVAFSVAMTTVSTLLSPLMTPLIILLIGGRWISVSPLSMFWSIAQIVILPLILGMVLKKIFSRQTERFLTVLPVVSVLAICLIIGGVAAGNRTQIFLSGLLVLTAVILHNIAGLFIGYGIGKILGIPADKRRAMAIETGMQNSGLAAALATQFFNPLAAVPGAIFSVWHNVSGSLLAAWWTRKDKIPEKEII
ncbi:MAG: hypothetical protein CVU87_07115 [Firmicutes bacterium HGW-Firmicutes-12]|nr:MAG: hypothetical protein CVU87_07115 [Firmicutes bacterium HGW-Firmicutes-12]